MEDVREITERKFENIEKKLHIIAEGFNKVDDEKAGEEAEDRKRLKERLKEALADGKQILRISTDFQKEGWLEFFFGICKPDGRVGKGGSRFVPCQMFQIAHIANQQNPQANSPTISFHTRYDT